LRPVMASEVPELVAVNVEWQDAEGNVQNGEICTCLNALLSDFKGCCARDLNVESVQLPDFNDDMDGQVLQELGIGLSDIPVLLELGAPCEAREPGTEESPKKESTSTSPVAPKSKPAARPGRAPLAVRQAVEDTSMVHEDWLFVGGQMAAGSLEGLQQVGITHVLNCCERVPCKFRARITYKVVNVLDTKSSNIKDFIPEALTFIDEVVAANGKVLVHCMVGASRSVSLVLAWLVARRHMPLKQAYQQVRSKRHQARPNRSFCEQLMDFERETLGSCSATLADFNHK